MIVAAQANETLDALCWRSLGRTGGVTEAAYAMNPGLASQGPLLDEGQEIDLPDLDANIPAVRESVKLWD